MAKNHKRRSVNREPIDVSAILTEKVTVGKDGRRQRLSPFEVGLRAQVKKALTENSLPAIKNVLDVALKYQLVMPPPEVPRSGGVLVVPGRFAKGEWAKLFEEPDAGKSKVEEE